MITSKQSKNRQKNEFEDNIWRESEQSRKALFILLKIAPAQPEKGRRMETIISSCISAAVTLIVCLISNHSQSEKTRALMEYKLEELTKRVDKHNNVVERTYSLEQKMVVQEEQIKVANHRISDLEEKENGHV